MMEKMSIEQYYSVNTPAVSAEKTTPLCRVHVGHGTVLDIIFYLKDALMAWLKFKKGHTFISSPRKKRQINKYFAKSPNKGETKNFMQLYSSWRFF